MNFLVLNTDLQVVAVLDTYNSLIWTDRFQEAGDFELCRPMERSVLDYIKEDYYIWRSDSEHTMIIEKILIESSAEEGDKLTVTGRSLESILDRRIIWGLKSLSGNFQDAIEELLNECIINPAKPERKIDNFIFEASTDTDITKLTIETQYTGDNLYDVIVALCKERDIGFKVTINASNQFVFKLYSGSDRSYNQFVNPYVIFSPNFDNIIDSNFIDEKSNLKNVTLVGGEGEGVERRYTAVGNEKGLNRRELFTDARDISSDSDDDITESFNFSQYPSQVFDESSKTFITEPNFNSCMVDVSNYAGRTLGITVPKVTVASGGPPSYSVILVNALKQYVATLLKWEDNGDPGGTEESPKARGSLATYEILLPTDAEYIYTSMYSQASIDDGIYYGELDDFNCQTVKLSNDEYIALLRQRGAEDLIENRKVTSFEGNADTTMQFRYGVDFFTGDIVQVADAYGHESKARVIEVVTSENEDGSSSIYPTFETIVEEAPWLPGGYTELEYIEATGTQYIDTDYAPNQNTRVMAEMEFGSSGFGIMNCLFGTRSTISESDSLAYALWSFNSGKVARSDFFGSAIQKSFNFASLYLTIDKNKRICQLNSTIISNSNNTGQVEEPLYLFALNEGSSGDAKYHTSAKLYSFQIYENETLVRNFIPCINPEGIVGLFDSVGLAFYGNLGTGSFVAGQKGA